MQISANKELMRQINRNRIVELIRQHEGIAQVDLIRLTGLSSGGVAGIVGQLKEEGLIVEAGFGKSPTGKRPVLLEFNPASRCVLAVELLAERSSVALLDMGGEILERTAFGTQPGRGPAAVVGDIARAAETLLESRGCSRSRLLGAGLAVEAAVDSAQRVATLSVNLGWQDAPLADLLEESLDLPVLVEGTAVAKLHGEYLYGAGRSAETVILLELDAGIGSPLMLHGRVVRGAHNLAGELGHTVVEPNGLPCSCGRQGCLETLATPRAILAWTKQQLANGVESELAGALLEDLHEVVRAIFAAAGRGDALARRAVERVANAVGSTTAPLVSLIDPDAIILTGCLAEAGGETFADQLQDAIGEHVLSDVARHVTVLPGRLGEQAALLGAAAMVCEREFRVPVR